MDMLSMIKHESVPIQIAIYSFIGGTILLVFGLMIPLQTDFMIFAVIFIFTVLFINSIVVLGLIYRIITSPLLRAKSIYELLIILSNIPITALYFFIIYNQNNLF